MTTIAGNGQNGFSDGFGSQASFKDVFGLHFDSNSENLYIAVAENWTIRKLNQSSLSDF